jgi:4-amino-4-deoxy-L-arabinose transferase-like glycosyltransferase
VISGSEMNKTATFIASHRDTFILIGILVLSLILRLAFLHEPFERDEGHYAAIAQEILRGGLPYRDAVEIKPPGAFYIYAFAIWIFGATTEGIRIFTALYATLTLLSVYAFARRIADVRAGLFAAATYGIFSTMPLLQGSSSNTEVFLVLPMTAGALFFVNAFETRQIKYLWLCGFCAAVSMSIKTVALPIVALEFLFIALIPPGFSHARETLKNYSAFVVPIISFALVICIYFLVRGGFEDFFYWNALFPIRYRNSGIAGPPLFTALNHLKSSLLFPMIMAFFSIPWFWSHKRTWTGLFTLMLIPAVWCSIALPGKYFPHYFINIVPFLAIPAGIALAHFSRLRRPSTVLVAAISIAILGFSFKENYKFYTEYDPIEVSKIKYGSTFASVIPVANYLKDRTLPEDYIFQWGLEPEIYFLADRRSPVPHLVSITIAWSKDPDKSRKELLEGLLTKRPKYIVFQDDWSNWPGLDEVQAVIDAFYVPDRILSFGYIARRKDIQ